MRFCPPSYATTSRIPQQLIRILIKPKHQKRSARVSLSLSLLSPSSFFFSNSPIPPRHQNLTRLHHPRRQPFRMNRLQRVAQLSHITPDNLLRNVHLLRLETTVLSYGRRFGSEVFGEEGSGGGVVVVGEDDGWKEERGRVEEEGRGRRRVSLKSVSRRERG